LVLFSQTAEHHIAEVEKEPILTYKQTLKTKPDFLQGITSLVIVVVFFLMVRLFGAWVLRINEVITVLYKILDELQKQGPRR